MQSRSTRRAVIAGLALSVFVVAASTSTSHLTAQFSFESIMRSVEQWRSQNFNSAPAEPADTSLETGTWDSTADQLPYPTLGIPTSTTQTPPINPVTGYPQGTSGDFGCKGCVQGVNCPANCGNPTQDIVDAKNDIDCTETDPDDHNIPGRINVKTVTGTSGMTMEQEFKDTCLFGQNTDSVGWDAVKEGYCINSEEEHQKAEDEKNGAYPDSQIVWGTNGKGYVIRSENCLPETLKCVYTNEQEAHCVDHTTVSTILVNEGAANGMIGGNIGNGIGGVGNGVIPAPSGTEGMQFPWQQFAAPAQNVLDQQNGVTVNDPMRGILYPAAQWEGNSGEPCPPVDGDVPPGGDEAVIDVGGRQVTFSTEQGLVAAMAVSIPAGAPQDTEFPMGMFGVVLRDVTPGGSVVVRLSGAPQNATGYTKYGPTAENSAHHFYDFAYDGTTGAKVQNGVIELHFVDGGRGDADLQANGVIVDPGGPTGPRGGGSPRGGPPPPPPRGNCGNGIREAGEQCDDGNKNGTDASDCTKNCQLDQNKPCNRCASYTKKDECNSKSPTCLWVQNSCRKGPYCPGDISNVLYCGTCTIFNKKADCKGPPCTWNLGCVQSEQYCPVLDQKCQNTSCVYTFRWNSNPFEIAASTDGRAAGFTANNADLGVYEYPLLHRYGRTDVAATSSEFNGDPSRPQQGAQIATDAQGSIIAYMGGQASYMQNKSLFLYDATRRKLFKIADQAGLPSLSADGKMLAYIDYPKRLHFYNRETGEDQTVEGAGNKIVEIAMRPDGQRAVYLKESGNYQNTHLYLLNRDDNTSRQLAIDEQITSRMRIQGEGTLYYKGNTVLVQTTAAVNGVTPLVCDTEAKSTKCTRVEKPGYNIYNIMGLSDDESRMLVKWEKADARGKYELAVLGTRSSFERVVLRTPEKSFGWHKMNARLSGDGNAVVATIPLDENAQEMKVVRIDVATGEQTVLFTPRLDCTAKDKEPTSCNRAGGGNEDIRCNAGETCVPDGTAFNCLIGAPVSGTRCRLSGRDGTCKKCPTSNECQKSECGPQLGMPNWQCADGSGWGGPTGKCLRKADGKCGWEINNCPQAKCGNKKVETGEECDDGNTTNGDGCSNTCKKEGTGQSGWYDPDLLDISRATEILRDGKPSGNKDKCRPGTDAFIEEQYTPDATTTPKGYTEQCPLYTKCLEGACLGKGPTPTEDERKCTDSDDDVSKPYRGFNIFVAGTAKRGSWTDSDVCYTTNIGTHLQETYCRRDGQIAHLTVRCPEGTTCKEGACVGGHSSAPVCGNGKLESPEECDDGNTKDGDGCSSTCKKEVRAADLSIELSAPVSVQQGKNLAYTLTVRNAGPSAAEGIETVLGVPSNVTIVSGETDTLCKKEENSIRCKPFTLEKNGSKTLKIVIGTSTFACNATLDQRAKVGSPVPDPNTSNNQSNAVHIDITCSGGGADLSIVMRAPQTVQTQEFEYQLDVKNAGPEDVMNDKVIVTLAGLQAVSTLNAQTPNANCSLAGGQVNCRLSLKTSQQVTLKLKVAVYPTYCGVMFNRAYVSGSQDPNQANNSSPTDIKGQQIYVCPNSSPVCGNGKVESPEECDDGNTKDGDGCSSTCKKESSNPVCGNGKKEGTEECDDGNRDNTDSCTNYCKSAKCGDAFVQPPEECDWNGNRGCNKECKAIPIHLRETDGLRIATNTRGEAVLFDMHDPLGTYVTWFDGTKWGDRKKVAGPASGGSFSNQLLALSLGDNGDGVAVFSFYDVYVTQHVQALRFNGKGGSLGTFANVKSLGPYNHITHPFPLPSDYDSSGNMTIAMNILNTLAQNASGTEGFSVSVFHIDAKKDGKVVEKKLPIEKGTRYGNFSVAMGPYGHAFASWEQDAPTGSAQAIRAMYSTGQGSWGNSMNLYVGPRGESAPAIADIDGLGRATAVWTGAGCAQSSGTSTSTGPVACRYNGSAWSQIGSRGPGIRLYTHTQVDVDDNGNVLLTTKKVGAPGYGTLQSLYFDASSAAWSAPSLFPNPRAEHVPSIITLGNSGKGAGIYVVASEYKNAQDPAEGAPFNAYGAVYDKANGWSAAIPLESRYPTVTVNAGVDVIPGAPTTFLWSRGVMKYTDPPEPQFSAY